MGIYANYVLPVVIDCACGSKPIGKQREKIVPHARGRVLEIGIGSGRNLPYYNPERVEKVFGLEPSDAIVKRAKKVARSTPLDVEWV